MERPVRISPSSHILKPAIRTLADTVTNEGFCLALAEAKSAKPAKSAKSAKSQVHSVLGRQFLLIERYDRMSNAQGLRQRLHQEDWRTFARLWAWFRK